jgi:translation initiation factor 2B subunit (eIF-2B alpha/beta/delta family)
MIYEEIDALINELDSLTTESALSRVRDLMDAAQGIDSKVRMGTVRALRRAGRDLLEGARQAAKTALAAASLTSDGAEFKVPLLSSRSPAA